MAPRTLPLVQPSDTAPDASMLFIAGLHRSGTTLIEHWLTARYDVTYLRAPVPENEGQHLQDVYPTARMHGGPGRFAFAPEMAPPPPPKAEAAAMRERLLRCWATWRTGGKARTLVEKSPPNLTKIAWLRRVFPGARFLIVTRDPRAVSLATVKMSDLPLPDLLEHYHRAHALALRDLRPSDCHYLSYEAFTRDPEGAAARAADALGLRPRPAPPNPPLGSRP
ncbi:MAG: sulfotransferase [Pseudomonadota bacterium]